MIFIELNKAVTGETLLLNLDRVSVVRRLKDYEPGEAQCAIELDIDGILYVKDSLKYITDRLAQCGPPLDRRVRLLLLPK